MNYSILSLDEVDSTNNYLIKLAQEPINEFTLVTTEYQTAGKGQRGNYWESNRGDNLLFSLLVKPCWLNINEQFILSMAVSVALRDVLSTYTDLITIKWPNDIYWNNKKIAGILIENFIVDSTIGQSVIGIGLNINQLQFESEAPNPISLSSIIGKQVDKTEVLYSFLNTFSTYYKELTRGNQESIKTSYWQGLYRNTGRHQFKDKNGIFYAQIDKIDTDGRIYLIDDNDKSRSYLFKEVAYII